MKFTRNQLLDYICKSDPVALFYQSAIRIGFWPDFHDYAIENLAPYLEDAEIDELGKIDIILNEHKDILNKYIAHIYSNRPNPWRITPGFLCELALILKFPELFTAEKLWGNGWDENLAKIVLSSAENFRLSRANRVGNGF